jgi:segregation and condensation protein A
MTEAAEHVEILDFQVKVKGQLLAELPKDLYIPPDALEVFLEAFQGPLDLLLYLIRKHNIDILDIPIAQITDQYIAYVEMMSDMQLELAAEYLVMAATLAEIKSRMLLPRNPEEDDEEDIDPRAELVRRLQLYEQFKRAALDLDDLPRIGRDTFDVVSDTPDWEKQKPVPDVDFQEMLLALSQVLKRADAMESHMVEREELTVREAMAYVLDTIKAEDFTEFSKLFRPETGRAGVIVTFLALLELLRECMIELVQAEPFAPIHVRAISDE